MLLVAKTEISGVPVRNHAKWDAEIPLPGSVAVTRIDSRLGSGAPATLWIFNVVVPGRVKLVVPRLTV